MKKPYHPKRTRLARGRIKDHKRRLARFNYLVKQSASACDVSEQIILLVLQVLHTSRMLNDYLFGSSTECEPYKHFNYSDYIKEALGGNDEQTSEETKA